MRRTKRKVATFRLGERAFEGNTVAEAKQAALDCAAEMLSGDYIPRATEWRGHLLFFWRGEYHWEYRITAPEFKPTEGGEYQLWGNGAHTDKERAWELAKRHLVQYTWDYTDSADESAIPGFITNKEDRQELAGWAAWQLRYRAFKEQGYTDQECHAMASGWKVENGRTVPA